MAANVASQLLACDVACGGPPSLLTDQPGVQEAPQVAARRRRRDIGLDCVDSSVGAVEEALLQSDYEALRPVALVYEMLEVRPPRTGLSELSQAAPGLRYVGFNAEPYERRRIPLRLK